MIPTATIEYLGELRTRSTHTRSGNTIITDAPVDNHGKGEAFSPTDLTATSLVTCMISIMGIAAQKGDLDFGNVSGSVQKIMAENPRRIQELLVEIRFQGNDLPQDKKEYLERVALSCPVAKSLHPDIRQDVRFVYD